MEELNGPTRTVRENQLFLFPRAAAFNRSHFSPFFSVMLAPQYPDPAECARERLGLSSPPFRSPPLHPPHLSPPFLSTQSVTT